MPKLATIAVAAVAAVMLAAGGVAFAVINPLSGVGAQDPPSTTAPHQGHAHGPGQRGHVLETALADLVQKGTITQAQADAVKDGVKAKAPKRRHGQGAGLGEHRFLGEAVKTPADVIGLAPKDLLAELRTGKSVADVAREKNIDPQKVIDTLVAKGNAAVDKAAPDGRLSADQAVKTKAKLPDLAQRLVNHKGGPGMGGGAWRHRGGAQGKGLSPTTAGPTPTEPIHS